MTHSPPPEPPPSGREPLGFDDFVGIMVAFLSMGAIFFWAVSQNQPDFDLSLFELAPATEPAVSPSPLSDRLTPTPSSITPPSPETNPLPDARLDATSSNRERRRGDRPIPVPVPVSQPSPAAATAERSRDTGFADVPSDHWAAPFIGELTRLGVLTGFPDGTFQPNQPVTRAEFAVMLQRSFEQPQRQETLSFADIPADFWGVEAINKSVQMGFMNGYPDNVFQPDQPIPKVQALIALATGLNVIIPEDPTDVVQRYQDADQIPPYAINKVAASTTEGLVVNYPDPSRLAPQQVVTRADAAALIYQALVQLGAATPVNSEYVVQP